MLKKLHYILLYFLFPAGGIAQDITGVWTGSIITNGNQLPYEIAISGSDDKLSGYSMTIFTIDGVENTGLKALKVKRKKDKITIEDGDLVEDDYSTKAKRVMLFSILSLKQEKSVWVLSGSFNSRAYFDQNYKGTIRLTKKSDFLQTKLVNKLGQLNLLHTLSFASPSADQKKIEPQPVENKEPDVVLEANKDKATPEKIQEKKEDPKKVLPSATDNVKVETPVAALPAADIAKRKTETIQTVFFFLRQHYTEYL